MFRTVLMAATMATAAICSATPAHADQNGYINALAGAGAVMTPDNVATMLKDGYVACDGMRNYGLSQQQVVSQFLAHQPETTPREAQLIVSAAHSQLCPDVS